MLWLNFVALVTRTLIYKKPTIVDEIYCDKQSKEHKHGNFPTNATPIGVKYPPSSKKLPQPTVPPMFALSK